MNSYKKHYKNKFNSINMVKIYSGLVFLVIIMLTIGYSTFYTGFVVDNLVAIMRSQVDIRIIDFDLSDSTSSAVSSYEEFNISSFSSSIYLPNSDSEITYDIEILNIGNTEMRITDVEGLPNNLTYEFNNYTLGKILCDDTDKSTCTLGSSTTISLTIKYASGMYNSSSTEFPINVNLVFSEMQYVARIGNAYYDTLQLAVNAVPKNNTLTKVILLRNTAERIDVAARQNVILDLSDLTLTNNGNSPVIENNGAVTITNGLIYSTASQGAINVNASGSLTMSGGSILATGTKQAIYNNGGMVTISGLAYIRNTTNQRAAVHNHLSSGSIVITGGTIISEKFSAVLNEAGTLIVGESGGDVNTIIPKIQGDIYGINNSTGASVPVATYFDYYDGLIFGRKAAIYDENFIQNSEPSYGIAHSYQYIGLTLYDTAHLAFIARVTFESGDGDCSEEFRNVEIGKQIGMLPVPTLTDYVFDGWYTAASDGTKVLTSTVINVNITLFAHWTHTNDVYIAQIGNTKYRTLASAVSAASNNTATSIVLIRDTAENITIAANKNITLDFQSYKLSSPNDNAVIVNNGKCQFISGTIETNSRSTSAINNNASGTFTMSGGSIVAKGLRQAIYNDGGKVTISGGYLEALTDVRATVQNHASGGSVTITGGSIVSLNFSAINNEAGNLFIGTKDGNIMNTPVAIGKEYGVINSATFKFYDGIIRGITGAISGTILEIEDNSSVSYTIEVINNNTYNKAFLN